MAKRKSKKGRAMRGMLMEIRNGIKVIEEGEKGSGGVTNEGSRDYRRKMENCRSLCKWGYRGKMGEG